jgi:hypothetical protein
MANPTSTRGFTDKQSAAMMIGRTGRLLLAVMALVTKGFRLAYSLRDNEGFQ